MTARSKPPSLTSVRSAVATRIRLLSLSLPAAAILLLLGQALTPAGLDHPIMKLSTAIREVPIAAAHSERLYVAWVLGIFGLGALGVSFAAIATLVRERGALLATLAALVGVVACFCGALVNAFIGYDLVAAATAHTARAEAEQVLLAANRGWVFDLLLASYLGGLVVATVAIAVALWRRVVRFRAGCRLSSWLGPRSARRRRRGRCRSLSSYRSPLHSSCWPDLAIGRPVRRW